MATQHIAAEPGDFAPVVVMPGDPLRSRLMAEDYLTDARLVNDVRGAQGYTGYYYGARISVMASGMGMPSIGIYAYELFTKFGVGCIIRAGSAGAYSDALKLRDIVIGDTASTDSRSVEFFSAEPFERIPASARLAGIARRSAEERGFRAVGGSLHTSDVFYSGAEYGRMWKARGADAVEMEAAMLYAVARAFGKEALAVCAISDYALGGDMLPAAERERGLRDMMVLALDVAARA